MIKVVGIKESKGEFTPEGKKEVIVFNNMMLYVNTDENEGVIGYSTGSIKVKVDRVQRVGFQTWEELIDHKIMVSYKVGVSNPEISAVVLVE